MKATLQIKDKNNGSNVATIGIKNMYSPDLTKNAFATQYKPRQNQPKANEKDKKNNSIKLFTLQIPKIANEKQNIKGYNLYGSKKKVAELPSKKYTGICVSKVLTLI